MNEKILEDHKSKSNKVKKLNKKLGNAVSLSKIEDKLRKEKSKNINTDDYSTSSKGFDLNGYNKAVFEKKVRIELLEEILQENKRGKVDE